MTTDHQRAIFDAMRDPGFYPHPVDRVEIRGTHISRVALAGEFVYKIKKPLDLGFLDFTTLEKRFFYCRQEVELNRRLSREVYLEVVPVNLESRYRLDGPGPAVEYAVKMRRLSDEDALSSRLRAGRLHPDAVPALARRLARFYAGAHRGPEVDALGDRETVRRNCEENFEQVEPYAGQEADRRTLDIVRAATRAFLHRRRSLFEQRLEAGKIRDCHGDLRAEHVYFEEETIQVIDCIEFNERFRFGDLAADLAFLAMDLDSIGFAEIADQFLEAFVAESGDHELVTLIDFYKCYRAMVRLKVSCFRLAQAAAEQHRPLREAIQRYQELAYGYALKFSRPVIWVVCGLPATGKSTIAGELARRLDVAVLASDAVRKTLFGRETMEAEVQSFEEGIYSPHATSLTYGRLLLEAQEQIEKGRTVILDATFGRRRRREEVVRLARDMDAGLVFIECTCADAAIRDRLAARKERPGISDARLDHFDYFKQRFEPLDEVPGEQRIRIDTQQPVACNLKQIITAAEMIGPAGRR